MTRPSPTAPELHARRPHACGPLAILASLALAACIVLTAAAAAFAQEEQPAEPPALPAEVLQTEQSTEAFTLRLVPLTKDELAALAAEWLAIVKAKTEEVVAEQIRALELEGEAAEASRERLTELTAERKSLFDKYSTVVDSWEKKGGDETAVAEYRAYRNSIIVEETRTADTQTLIARALAWVTAEDGGIELARDIAVIVGSLFGLFLVARLIRRFSRRWIGKVPNLSKLLQAFIVVVIYWLTIAVGLAVVLSALGVDITPIFALIGGASFVLAFALQSTLGNLASGLMIMINRPFDEGDYVDVGGVGGTVKSVSIVSTTVITPDNQVIVVPNNMVWGGVITNVTTCDTRRVDLTFGISYEDDIEKAIEVLKEAVAEHPGTLDEPEPVIVVGALADSSVNILCRPWSRTEDYWTVYWDLTRDVKERFDRAGISIPYPQQDVHMHTAPPRKPPVRGTTANEPEKPHEPRDAAEAIAEGEEGHETT